MDYINLTTAERQSLWDLCILKNASIPAGMDYVETLSAPGEEPVVTQTWAAIRDNVPEIPPNHHPVLNGIEQHDDGYYYYAYGVEPNPEPVEVVPTEVSRFQAYAAIKLEGFWDDVTAYFADPNTPWIEKTAWETVQVFYRDSQLVNKMAKMLGMDDQALDSLFITAGKIKA